jgi:hypothetical protein
MSEHFGHCPRQHRRIRYEIIARSKTASTTTTARITYAKVSLNFGLGTPGARQPDRRGGVLVDEVDIEVVKEVETDESNDVEARMVLLNPAEELTAVVDASVERVERVEEMDGALVTSEMSVGNTVVY